MTSDCTQAAGAASAEELRDRDQWLRARLFAHEAKTPPTAPEGVVNLARGAAVQARTSLESPPLWSKDYLVDGVRAAGGYCSRSATARIHVTTGLGGFIGAWRTINEGTAYGGKVAYGTKIGGTFEYAFTGDAIAWIGGKNTEHGEAEVFIDGKLEATVSTKSPKLLGQEVLFRKDKLGPGRHTIRIRVSSEGATDINALDITDSSLGPVKADAAPGEVEEWIEIDLGADKAFSHVRLCPVWLHSRDGTGAPSFPADYAISVKPQGGAYATVKTVSGQVNPGVASVTLPVGDQRARYVKIAVSKVGGRAKGDSQDLLRLAEVEVLGRATSAPAAPAAPKLPERNWRLQTDDTAMTLAVIDDRPRIVALQPAKGGWNWIKAPVEAMTLPTEIDVAKDKSYKAVAWKFKDAVVDTAQGTKLTLVFACEVPGLELRPAWWAAEGRGPIQYTPAVSNKTGKSVALKRRIDLLDLGLQCDRVPTLWRFHKDPGGRADGVGLYLDPMRGDANHDVVTGGLIPLGVLDAGDHGLYVACEWQAGTIGFSASSERAGELRVRIPAHNRPQTDVASEVLELPSVYLGAYVGDVDEGVNGLKKWYFRHKAPPNMRSDAKEPYTQWGPPSFTYKGGWRPEQEVYYKAIKERLSDTGYEMVVIDNGWWPDKQEGNWVGDPKRWPDGMAAASKLTHEHGFKFTLYFLLRGSRNYEEYGKRLLKAMNDYDVDTYRSDFGAPSGPGGLAMLDWLAANRPNFRYESCDGGGRWKDYATMRRASIIFAIDVYDPLSLRKCFHTSSYCLPPAQIQLPADNSGVRDRDLFVFAYRSGMMGALHGGYTCMPSDKPFAVPAIKENLSLYKTRLRPLIRQADLYHLSLRPDNVDWDAFQYHDAAAGKGAVLLFKPASKADTRRFFLRGLDRAKNYSLTFQDRPAQNARKTGAELMDQGLDVTMTRQHASEIIWIDGPAERAGTEAEERTSSRQRPE